MLKYIQSIKKKGLNMREITVNENDSEQRLDKFLSKFMPQLPKSVLYKGLRKNCVRINGKHVKDGSVFIHAGDVLKLYYSDEFFEDEKNFKPIKSKLDIVYEDENILIINKESGIVVHADDRGTENTLVAQLQSYLFEKGEYKPDAEHSFSPALCSRLDRNTGGLVIAAKNAAALRIINEKIRSREIHKFYLCITEGYPFDKGTLSGYLTRGNKKVTVSDEETPLSKPVKLKYRVIAKKHGLSLTEVELITGRTHQIRAQFAHIGCPLAGDVKYGGSRHENYQELMSCRIEFGFKTDAGILNYLAGSSFSVSADFAESFLSTN